jgi:hypothetical protein
MRPSRRLRSRFPDRTGKSVPMATCRPSGEPVDGRLGAVVPGHDREPSLLERALHGVERHEAGLGRARPRHRKMHGAALSGDDVMRDEPSTGLQDASNLAIEPPGGRRCSSRNAASRRGRRLCRWNRDPPAPKNALQRRDAGGDITFPAVFQRHSGFQGLGITVRVVAVI